MLKEKQQTKRGKAKMLLTKAEAKVLYDLLGVNMSFAKIGKKFNKQFNRELPFDQESDMIREVARKLKLDCSQLIEERSTPDNYYWNLYGTNAKCQSCVNNCKQHAGAKIAYCPKYKSANKNKN